MGNETNTPTDNDFHHDLTLSPFITGVEKQPAKEAVSSLLEEFGLYRAIKGKR
jgi:hypothetical protein